MGVWLSENWGTLLVGLIVLAVLLLAVRKIVLDRKNGKSYCSSGGNCEHCAMKERCEKHEEKMD